MKVILIAHNIRSCHNVGSLLRSADGLGVEQVYLTGYSPYPRLKNDTRLPHLAAKLDRQIAKTALGAEKTVGWHHVESVDALLTTLRSNGCRLVALEQHEKSTELRNFTSPSKIALIVGPEVEGLDEKILEVVDDIVEIPMHGAKESLNVSVAAAVALYQLTDRHERHQKLK